MEDGNAAVIGFLIGVMILGCIGLLILQFFVGDE